jgi:hypothetical protein
MGVSVVMRPFESATAQPTLELLKEYLVFKARIYSHAIVRRGFADC